MEVVLLLLLSVLLAATITPFYYCFFIGVWGACSRRVALDILGFLLDYLLPLTKTGCCCAKS
jgi:hypothetical protein